MSCPGDYGWRPLPRARAARYLDVCERRAPGGGVFVGYSFAGNICFEMALLLQERGAAGGRRYPFEMILVEPVPPYQRTRAPDETLLEHAARFGDKCLCAEMFPALFGTGDVTLDLGGRVARRELRTQDALWAFLCGAVGLDGRFAGDFEKMTEFIFNLRLEPPRAALDRDVHYFLIEPDGWKHYDFYWGYTGDLAEPWKDFVAPGREFTVHRGVEGNHFQAFDTDANMDVIKAVVQPLLDGLDRRPAADAAVENE